MPSNKKAKFTFASSSPTMPALKRDIGSSVGPLPPAFKRESIDRRADKNKKRGK
jgi:hypothetical protein